ncbi:MAG: phosphoribosyltransferase family protein [Panacibacter sp.]
MIKIITSYLNDFTHLFFPHNCESCGTDILENETMLCAACLLKLPETGFINTTDNPVEKIFYGRIKVEAAGSAFYFNKDSLLQHLIVELKYRGNKNLGFYLGKLLGYKLAQSARFNTVDAIIPLPLNKRKEKKRGYNQAASIADGIAEVWQKTVLKNSVERMVFTETQTHKDRISRWQTMNDVFTATDIKSIENKHILLIDDIVTTGATLEACGAKILEASGTRLSIVTVAYTI